MIQAYVSEGSVGHVRQGSRRNAFHYPVFTLVISVQEESSLRSFFKKRFFGYLNLRPQDYLRNEVGSLNHSIRQFLKTECSYQADDIWLQTFPRMFGYVFNPVSFWFCKKNGILDAVLCEVNNTFGEKHFYWIHKGRPIESSEWIRAEKVFHVSPFFPVEGYYCFRFNLQQDKSRVDISYFGPQDDLRLATWVEGIFTPIEKISPLRLLFSYGWMTPLVVLRIHWQAVKLWFKKNKFYSKPQPPGKEISS